MKKLSAILALIIALAVVSGCDSKPSTTEASATEPTAAVSETSETTEAPAASESTAGSEDAGSQEEENKEGAASFEDIKDKAPHFYGLSKYIVAEKSTVVIDKLDDDFNVVSSTVVYTESKTGLRVSVQAADASASSDIMLKNSLYYIVSHAQKKAFDAEMGYSMLVAMDDEMRRTIYGFKMKAATVDATAGEEELNGVMYDTETVTDGENTSIYYADKQSGEVKYMKTASGFFRINECRSDIPEDAFDIPEDYEIVHTTETSE